MDLVLVSSLFLLEGTSVLRKEIFPRDERIRGLLSPGRVTQHSINTESREDSITNMACLNNSCQFRSIISNVMVNLFPDQNIYSYTKEPWKALSRYWVLRPKYSKLSRSYFRVNLLKTLKSYESSGM